MTTRKKLAIGIMVAPPLILFIVIILQIITRFVFLSGVSSGGDIIRTIINLVTIVGGFTAAIGFVPAIIAGVVLLATDSKPDAAVASRDVTSGNIGDDNVNY